MAVKRAAKQVEKPTETPDQPAKISVEFTPEDLQHLIAMTQVGAQKMIDNIVSKATSLTEEIKQKLPQE